MTKSRLCRLPIALAAAVALTTGFAAAQQGDGAPEGERQTPRTFTILDADGNDKVTLDEIFAEQKRLISASDLDGDGKLSVMEFRRRGWWFQRLRTTTLFDLMDANGDLSLTADEIAAPSARWFKRYDADADGNVTVEELPKRKRGKRRRNWR